MKLGDVYEGEEVDKTYEGGWLPEVGNQPTKETEIETETEDVIIEEPKKGNFWLLALLIGGYLFYKKNGK